MKDTMPQFIADEHFLELFRFVVDLGAQAGPFIADLRSFHDKFVDPKVRNVRTSPLAVFNMIPEQFSFTKVASVKHVYSCHPSRVQHGYCELFRRQLLKQILDDQKLREVMREGEDVLSFFHASCSQALAALAKADKTWFLGNLDRDIFTAVMGGYGGRTGDAPATTRQADLHLISEKFYVRLASLVEGNSAAALPPRSWKTGFLVAPAPPTIGAKLESKVLVFDKHGKPLSAQDTSSGQESEHFEWQSFFKTTNVAASAKQERIRSLVFSVLCRIQRGLESASTRVEVDIARGGVSKQPQVIAAKAFEINQVFMVPLVKTTGAISFKEGLPWELAVDVKEGDAAHTTAYIQGSSTLPKLPAASAAVESLSQSRRTDHAWKTLISMAFLVGAAVHGRGGVQLCDRDVSDEAREYYRGTRGRGDNAEHLPRRHCGGEHPRTFQHQGACGRRRVGRALEEDCQDHADREDKDLAGCCDARIPPG